MPSTIPPRLQLNRALLTQAFPNQPQLVLALEQIFQTLGTPGSGTTNTTGELVPFAGATLPSGWLLCDGSAVSRAAYANLFSVIETTWGDGDGQTTFNVPDMRNRMPIGASATYPLGTAGGSATSTLAVSNLPAHSHGVTDPGHAHAITDPGHAHTARVNGTGELAIDYGSTGAAAVQGSTGEANTGITINAAETGIEIQSTGQGAAINTISPWAAVNWIIKT